MSDEPRPVGRPTLYTDKHPEQARKLALLGMTDAEMADFFLVTPQTFNNWKNEHPEFFDSLMRGKEFADGEVAVKFYERAVGYSHEAVKIFMPAGASEPVYAPYIEHYPPDVGAAKMWLASRQGKRWRDKTSVEISGVDGEPIKQVISLDPQEASRQYQRLIAGED